MYSDQAAVIANGINFDVTARPSIVKEMVVATFVDGNNERHKVELPGADLSSVSEQLLQYIKGENVPFTNKARLYMNPSNPIFLHIVKSSEQSFAPPSTVSPFVSHNTYSPSL